MKIDHAATEFEVLAADALKALLDQVSAIKLKELKHEPQARGRSAEILAHIDVHGHSHTLACEVNCDTRPSKVRASLKKLRDCAAHFAGDATPVLIAPYLSPEVQAMCKESRAGFLDLEGNARLTLGDVFIGKRSVQQRPAAQSALQ
ncbi:MAG: hypothetical protein ABSD59_21255 [Terracidiphilus sp.]|jgi:hypothetical protein